MENGSQLTDSANDTASKERAVVVCNRSPDADNEKNYDGSDVNWSFPVCFSDRIDEEHTEAQGQDEPCCGLRERVHGYSELLRNGNEARAQHWTICANNTCGKANDEQNYYRNH